MEENKNKNSYFYALAILYTPLLLVNFFSDRSAYELNTLIEFPEKEGFWIMFGIFLFQLFILSLITILMIGSYKKSKIIFPNEKKLVPNSLRRIEVFSILIVCWPLAWFMWLLSSNFNPLPITLTFVWFIMAFMTQSAVSFYNHILFPFTSKLQQFSQPLYYSLLFAFLIGYSLLSFWMLDYVFEYVQSLQNS